MKKHSVLACRRLALPSLSLQGQASALTSLSLRVESASKFSRYCRSAWCQQNQLQPTALLSTTAGKETTLIVGFALQISLAKFVTLNWRANFAGSVF